MILSAWLLIVLLIATPALAQSPCRDSIACQQQRVLDLRDYREWVEEQLALAKALLIDANKTIAQQVAEIRALRDAAGAPAPKPQRAP